MHGCNVRDRHERPILRPHSNVLELVDRLAIGEWELNANVDQTVLRSYPSGYRAVDGESRRIRGVGGRDPQDLGPLGIDVYIQPGRGRLIARLNVDAAGRIAQELRDFLGRGTDLVLGPRDRIEDRRPRTAAVVAGDFKDTARHQIPELTDLYR